jgi:WD40 repeat protein
MSWPLSQDYNEAIQSPATSFSDPELKAGQAATNALGIPQPRSGNFADVYEFDCPQTQSKWAIKCFTREVKGLRERYAEISRCLKKANLPFTVDFQFLEQGIRIQGKWYPILKMRWVEGLLLNEFVRANLDKPARLQALSDIWKRMAKRLREAELAHADLQHGNVILVPGSTANSLAIKLIDYDGMFVPALAGKRSGEVGHPNYQHPQRLREGTYSAEVDRFPLLVVATALRALTVVGPQLWVKHDNGDNLLFKENDLQAPGASELFSELLKSGDGELRSLAEKLSEAVSRPLEQCPLLEEAPASKTAPATGKKTGRSVPGALDFENSGEAGSTRLPVKKRGIPLIFAVLGGAVTAFLLMLGLVWLIRPGQEKTQPGNTVAKGETDTSKKRREKPDKTGAPLISVVKGPKESPDEPVGEVRQYDTNAEIRRLAWSRDGKQVLAACADTTIRLFDMPDLKLARQLTGHTNRINGIAFITGTNKAMSGGFDKTLRLWDLIAGRELKTLDAPSEDVHSLTVSADGRWGASCGRPNTILVWDLKSEKIHRQLTTGKGVVEVVALSPKGDILVSGDGDGVGSVRVWRVEEGRVEHDLVGHKGTIFAVQITEDGRYAVSSCQDKTIRLWSLRTGKELKRYEGHTDEVFAVAVSADGRRLLSGSRDRTIRLWDTQTGQQIEEFTGHTSHIWDVAFSPDGRYAVSGGGDGILRMWRLPPADPSPAKPLDLPHPTTPGNEEQYEGHTGPVYAVAFSPDGKQIATGGVDKTIRLWDRESRKTLKVLRGHPGDVMGVAFSPDGKRLTSCGSDENVRLWDLQTEKEVARFIGNPTDPCVRMVAFSPDGRRLLTAGDDQTMLLWDVAGQYRLRRFDHPGHVRQALFTPDGHYAVSSCADGGVRVWSLETGRQIRLLQGEGDAFACALLGDGYRIACGSFDTTIRLWDGSSGKLLHHLRGHTGRIEGIAVSPDDRYALSCAEDRTVRLWDLTTGKEIKQFPYDCRQTLAFSPDGQYGLCGGQDNIVRLWRLPIAPLPPVKRGQKPAVPDADAQKTAQTEIRQRFKKDYVVGEPAARAELAQKLITEGLKTDGDLAERYVYLREARDIALQANKLDMSQRAIQEIAFLFATDELTEKMAAVQAAARSTSVEREMVARAALDLISDAVAANKYDIARRAWVIENGVAKKQKNRDIVLKVNQVKARLDLLEAAYKGLAPAVETLARRSGGEPGAGTVRVLPEARLGPMFAPVGGGKRREARGAGTQGPVQPDRGGGPGRPGTQLVDREREGGGGESSICPRTRAPVVHEGDAAIGEGGAGKDQREDEGHGRHHRLPARPRDGDVRRFFIKEEGENTNRLSG